MARAILTHKQKWLKRICEKCNKNFECVRWQPETKFCSKECYHDSRIGKKLPPFSDEHKRKIGESKIGKPLSQKHKNKLKKILSKSVKLKKHLKNLTKNYHGSGHPRWKGGRRYDGQGYILIYSPNHPNKSQQNCVHEHRLIMEKHIGRFLKHEEQIHHINKIRDDNRIENLELFANASEHTKHHFQSKQADLC